MKKDWFNTIGSRMSLAMRKPCNWIFPFLVVVVSIIGCVTEGNMETRIKTVRLVDIPAISPEVLQAQGKLVHIEDPVMCLDEPNTYLFTVTILSRKNFSKGTYYEFAADAERIRHFVNEVKFVNEGHGGILEGGGAIYRGSRDDIWGMVKGLAGIVWHPIDSAVALTEAGQEALKYIKKVYKGETDMRADALEFAGAYATNVYMEEAARFNLNFKELQTPEAVAAVQHLGRTKIVGKTGTELLLLYLAWTKAAKVAEVAKAGQAASKAGKAGDIAETAKLTRAGKWSEFFSFGTKAEQGAARTAEFASAMEKMPNLEKLAYLLSPDNIPTGERALNPRLHKVLYWLNQEEKAGKNPAEALTRAMKDGGAAKRVPAKFLDPKIDHAQIMKNYETAKRLKIFDDAENLEKMRGGYAPVVWDGPFAGPVEVDHIVPFRDARELDNAWGNLQYADRRFNSIKGPKSGQPFFNKRMGEKLAQYRDAGMLPQSRVDEILRSSLKVPASN